VTSGVFGAYLVLSGVALVVLAFSLPVSTSAGRLLNFISGVASVILGILAFRHFGEGYAVLLLAIWIGVGFIIRGVSALVTAIADKLIPGRRTVAGQVVSVAHLLGRPVPLAAHQPRTTYPGSSPQLLNKQRWATGQTLSPSSIDHRGKDGLIGSQQRDVIKTHNLRN
jgi:hypothetical protein